MGSKPTTNPSPQNLFVGGDPPACKDDVVEVRTGVAWKRKPGPVADPVEACPNEMQTVDYNEDYIQARVVDKSGNIIKNYDNGITIKVKCSRNKKPHVIQFVYREVFGTDEQPKKGYTAGAGMLTTDPNDPQWRVDTSRKLDTGLNNTDPHFDLLGVRRLDADSLTVFDQPAFEKDVLPKEGERSRVTFKAYTICD